MNTLGEADAPARRSRRRGPEERSGPRRSVNYRHLRTPIPIMSLFADDEAAVIHETAPGLLEELGPRVLLPEA
jgi:trimethylamine--corrinoid protein Co-methyltransferase